MAPQIQFELRLRTRNLTGRPLQGGRAGACGVLLDRVSPPCENRRAFDGTSALSFENSGHVGADMTDTIWALNAPALRIDFAHRAAHVMAVVARAAVGATFDSAELGFRLAETPPSA